MNLNIHHPANMEKLPNVFPARNRLNSPLFTWNDNGRLEPPNNVIFTRIS